MMKPVSAESNHPGSSPLQGLRKVRYSSGIKASFPVEESLFGCSRQNQHKLGTSKVPNDKLGFVFKLGFGFSTRHTSPGVYPWPGLVQLAYIYLCVIHLVLRHHPKSKIWTMNGYPGVSCHNIMTGYYRFLED